MSTRLEARLLGEVTFRFGEEVVTPRSRKLTALMAMLALKESGLRRDALAELIWPPGKLASLRQALYELRRLPGAGTWLLDGDELVRIDAFCDVAEFERALRSGDTTKALRLYAGDLLGDQAAIDSPAYEDWLTESRARLAELRIAALSREAARLEAEGSLEDARATLLAALALNPLDESLYRTAMRVAYALGDARQAKEFYAACVKTLRDELGLEPEAETRELAGLIERSEPLATPIDLSALSGGTLRLLQAVAIAEGALGVKGIAAVVERPEFEVAADIAGLERGAVVDEHLVVSQRHLEAAKASVPPALRRLLHERVADQLEVTAGADDAVVARHLLAAGKPREAAPRLVLAARRAIEGARLGPAAELLYQALWAGFELPDLRLEAMLLLEGTASQRGDDALQDEVLAAAEVLAWELQSDLMLAEVRMRRSRQQLLRGKVGEGLELALEALEIATRLGDGALTARARNALGGAHYFAGDLDGAAAVYAANVEAPDLVERYRAHSNLGSLAAMRGAVDEATLHFESALTLARAIGPKADVAATLNNVAATAERVGDYQRAVRHFREGIALSRSNQAGAHEARMLVNLAVVYARQGQLGPAWNTAAEVEELAEERSDARLRLSAVELKADVMRLCGMLSEAESGMREAREAAEAIKDERKLISLSAQLETVRAVRSGELAAAEPAITAVAEARLTDVAPWLWLELALAAKDAATARAYLAKVNLDARLAHLGLVAAVATVRTALLPGATGADLASARAAASEIGSKGDEGALDSLEIVEGPLGRLIVAAWEAAGGPTGALAHLAGFELPQAVVSEVEEQAKGLPVELAAALRLQPRRWLASLQSSDRNWSHGAS